MRVHNVARVLEDSDYLHVKTMCLDNTHWNQVYTKKDTVIWSQLLPNNNFNMIKASVHYRDIAPDIVFDVLQDSEYRAKWDKYMVKQVDIGLINPNNDICYYALSSIPPIRPRDFVLQRSWLDMGNEKFIRSHSVCHDDHPPNKNHVRGNIILSGYYIRARGAGCEVYYISHVDPRGKLPTWFVNRITKVVAPKLVKKMHKACLKYAEWKMSNNPDWKPWLNHHQQIDLPRVDLSKCQRNEERQEIVDESKAAAPSKEKSDEEAEAN